MNFVRDMVISSEFLNIGSYKRLISCLTAHTQYVCWWHALEAISSCNKL